MASEMRTLTQIRNFLSNRVIYTVIVPPVAAFMIYVGIKTVETRQYYNEVRHVRQIIEELHPRRPPDVPAAQWSQAVDWTSNVICQDFFSPKPGEYESLCHIAAGLEQKVTGNVDLGTLRWIWDQCEEANGGAESYAIRFRRIKLMTKGSITDERLPEIWSLDRCTVLDLSDTEISDESVAYLKSLKLLQTLDVSGTRITDEGAFELGTALPGCRIIR